MHRAVKYEELISKTAYIHSYMLLIRSSGHSKEAKNQKIQILPL